MERCSLVNGSLGGPQFDRVGWLDAWERGEQFFDVVQGIRSGSAYDWDLVVDIVQMGKDHVHSPFVAANLADSIL